ncbi:signal transduction histidine kinase [Prauserella muralis]|nr:signal transduction histidine kinase [Prauserella muralis]
MGLLLAALIAATVWGEYASGARGLLLGLDIAVGVLGASAFPALLRLPTTAGLVVIALAAVSPAATPPATVAVVTVARGRHIAVAVGVALAGVAAHAVRGLWRPMPGLSYGWWLLLVVVAHGALLGWGALAKARRALIESLEDRARRAEAEQGRRIAEARAAERARIAREMHDVLAHRLSLLATYAGALEYRPDLPGERVADAAGVIRSTAHQALDELRDVILLLRDDAGGDAEPERPVPGLADLPGLVDESRSTGTAVLWDGEPPAADTVPQATGRTAYRIVQEALTNARKHAPGQPVRLVLGGEPGTVLSIDVSNPLPAGPPPARPPGAGTGLVGLTERVRLAGGRLDHDATAGRFRLRASLPWPP